ncbi:MAG: hypothetical protein U9Q78_01360 [Chloroflexota bacterium]|nr:hypothetical protein [Chloroflexota bacterium]
MGLVEFLRRVKRKEVLPQSLRVQGLDAVLEEAQDTTETAKVIRNLLAMRNDYMGRQRPFIVFPVRASLEEAGGPRMFVGGKPVDLSHLFGNRLERERRHWFKAGFNLTRG